MNELPKDFRHLPLKAIDDLILRKLNPEDQDFDCEPDASYLKTLDASIRDSIIEKISELNKDDEESCFIRNCQIHLIYLSNCTTSYMDKYLTACEYNFQASYALSLRQVSNLVVNMLYFLNTYFPLYFDQDTEVPQAVKEKAKQQFAAKIMEIYRLKNCLQHKLIHTVLLPVLEFQSDDPELTTTFGRIFYLEIVLNETIKILKNGSNIEDDLKWKLVYLNFNSLPFFCYMQKEIKENTDIQQKKEDKLRILNWYLKQVRQIGEKSSSSV